MWPKCGPFHHFGLHADQVRNCGPLWKHCFFDQLVQYLWWVRWEWGESPDSPAWGLEWRALKRIKYDERGTLLNNVDEYSRFAKRQTTSQSFKGKKENFRNLDGRGDVELCLVVLCSPSPPTDLQGGEHNGEIAATWKYCWEKYIRSRGSTKPRLPP